MTRALSQSRRERVAARADRKVDAVRRGAAVTYAVPLRRDEGTVLPDDLAGFRDHRGPRKDWCRDDHLAASIRGKDQRQP